MSGYVKKIDLTSKSRAEREKSTLFQEPNPALAEATVDSVPRSLQEAVRRLGWKTLMPVQAKAIPYMLANRDIIVQSKTGSGKTGAFLLPLLEKLDPGLKRPQALILTPTRELARQIYETFVEAVPMDFGLSAVSVYGGVGYGPQIQAFNDGAQLVVGTPGRVLDHLAKRSLKLDDLRVLILDEADEMLSVGFWPAMQELRRYLPRGRESYMFSATMPYKVQSLGEEFLNNPGFLSLGRVSVDEMSHRYAVTAPMDKNQTIVRFIELENPESAIIFCNTKRRVEYLSLYLQNYGFDARGLSGDLSQKDREKVMAQIRSGRLKFLVATDVAARGIDISDLSHILMYDVPMDPEYYVHRAGRTARAGKTGKVVCLATVTDEHTLKSIGKEFSLDLEKVEVPHNVEVESHVRARVIELLEARIRSQSEDEKVHSSSFVPIVTSLMQDGHIHWLSMLVDGFYHETLHVIDSGSIPRQTDAPPPEMDELSAALDAHLETLSNLGKERLLRFEPLVAQMIEEGEPELPAMLLADFCTQPPAKKTGGSVSQPERQPNRGRGKPRRPR
jgi:ATP-dependent RNA helicase DeaD